MVTEKKIKEVILGSTLPGSARSQSSSANKFETDMREDASSLVMGGIVEKNVSSNHTFAPISTVLPFPVARHRSSGPHWKPVSVIEDKTVALEAESGDIINSDSVASFAKPVQREKRNALDFKPLRGYVLDSHCVDSEKVNEDDYVKECKSQSETPKGIDETSGGNEAEVILSSFPALKSHQSDIDSENQLRLQEMSVEEIAEAQAELKMKMNPSLIDFLRKRGLSKKKNLSAVDPNHRRLETESHELKNESSNKKNSLGSSPSSSTNCIPETIQNTSSISIAQNIVEERKNNLMKNFKYASSSSWDSWSQRVEAVRDFRFSLEGTIISDPLDADSMSVKSKLGFDSVGERDILRSEGDPAASGYTIMEVVQLTRSVIPGQRSIALHLLASLLNRAINGLQKRVSMGSSSDFKPIDWEAIWGYTLGPEPELALVLRLCLDDNHNLVVFTCAKAIHSALTCHLNEHFFNISEKVGSYADLFTAPIFRSKPEVETGFIRGGFWKLSAKSSSILNTAADEVDEDEADERHTIRDDVFIAEQDFTAGLVKMGIIQKLLYLLENNPSSSMEEYIVSSFVAIARHSPTCANAVFGCPGLINTVVQRFPIGVSEYTNYAKISSVVLLKVLAKADKKNCSEFMIKGYFQIVASSLFQPFSSLNDWIKLGKERGKFFSKLIVEQLRYWKVCINNGFGLSYFQSIFSTLCLWLARPSLKILLDNDLFGEFASVSAEAFLVLCSLARRLPNIYCQDEINDEGEETEDWEWSFVTPLVDSSIFWLTFKNDPNLCNLLAVKNDDKGLQCSFLWVLSSVFHFLSTLLERIIPKNEFCTDVPWLPEFVPLIGLEILKQRFLWCPDDTENSVVAVLCFLREHDDDELSLASTSCLSSLLLIVISVDNLIKLNRSQTHNVSSTDPSLEEKILEEGIQQRCFLDLNMIFDSLSSKISSQWVSVQSIEAFGRGGPAPGVGIGWGVPGGGFWSTNYILTRQESEILCHMITRTQDFNCVASDYCVPSLIMKICLTFGASDRENCAKLFDCLFGVPVLKKLGSCVQEHFRSCDSSLDLGYTEDDYAMVSARLLFHYSNFWLSPKQKDVKQSSSLPTIQENTENSGCSVEMTGWANQRLPLPLHWLCSSIATSPNYKYPSYDVFKESYDGKEIARSGLFFLLGVEVLSSTEGMGIPSPVSSIPLIWKLHSLSASLLTDMSVLEDDKSRAVYKALQDIYSGYLDKSLEIMRFQTEIHQNYCTFVETLVEQFSAESYGDVVFGRQVAIYLQSRLEAPVKLAAWNALSSARALDILPALEKCIGMQDAYLSPMEDSDSVLEAYAKSWISGALDRAFTRGSMAFLLAVHHLSSFLFAESNGNISLKKKVVKFLVRDYVVSPKRQEMMMYLMRYNGFASKYKDDVDTKFCLLVEACDNDSSLLALLEKFRSNFA